MNAPKLTLALLLARMLVFSLSRSPPLVSTLTPPLLHPRLGSSRTTSVHLVAVGQDCLRVVLHGDPAFERARSQVQPAAQCDYQPTVRFGCRLARVQLSDAIYQARTHLAALPAAQRVAQAACLAHGASARRRCPCCAAGTARAAGCGCRESRTLPHAATSLRSRPAAHGVCGW